MYDQRLERTRETMRMKGVDALLVGPSADLRWLVGYDALALERLTLLIVPAEGPSSLLVPALEAPRARDSGAGEVVTVHTWEEDEDPFQHVVRLAAGAGADSGTFAVQDRLWASFVLELQDVLDGEGWVPGSSVLGPLRMRKTDEELDRLRAAGQAIDAVHARVPSVLEAGRTEDEVGRDIAAMIREDHDEVAFVIVASGPNGASPHHHTGARRLEEGDAVVVDIGGVLDGYCSDSTRNYAVGRIPDGYAEVHEIVQQAQHAGVSAVEPGVRAEEVDAAARTTIEDAGYGEQFIHRTGHGIGIEEHEPPWIVVGDETRLEAGMTFSVEPGIYVPDRYGARVEDIVAVTETGVERLNTRSRDLVVV